MSRGGFGSPAGAPRPRETNYTAGFGLAHAEVRPLTAANRLALLTRSLYRAAGISLRVAIGKNASDNSSLRGSDSQMTFSQLS